MKFQKVFWLIVLSYTSAVVGQNESGEQKSEPKPRIEDCRNNIDIDLKQLVTELARCDVVFLGEKHDNDAGHQFQLSVIQALVEDGNRVVVSMEQFERDVQGAINDYLNGRIDEDQFLKASRPWKNYKQHYRPIIEFAKKNKLPILASNIPRRIANDVASGKEIDAVDRPFLPRSSNATKNAYWRKFKATMQGHLGADGDEKLTQFFASQCLKDDAMAETITDFIAENSHQRKIVVHLCGHFHSDYGLGTAARVIQRKPLTRFAVVTMELPKPAKGKSDLAKVRSRGHYVFWSTKNRKQDSKKQKTN